MKRSVYAAACAMLISAGPSIAGPSWTAGWGMGVAEYAVEDADGNALLISCPEEDYISAEAVIRGDTYRSEADSGFDVIVDGVRYSNPFFTDCRVCGDIFRSEFWDAFRTAKSIQVVGKRGSFDLPTAGLREATRSLSDVANSCHPAW